MSDLEPKAPGGVPGRPVVKPTKPGQPEAPPQPESEGSDPTVPTAPPAEAPAELPTDPLHPSDPTVPVVPTTADPVLELPPEGMLRISMAGEDDQFVFPVHADRWAVSGWTVHPPVTIDRGQAAPIAEELAPEALLGDRTCAALTGPGTIAAEGSGPQAVVPQSVVPQAAVPALEPAPLEAALLEPAPLESRAASAEGTGAALAPPDYAAMTKAQIALSCEQDYGVLLDESQTKAVLVEEANKLWQESRTAPLEPPAAAAPDTTIPGDLLL